MREAVDAAFGLAHAGVTALTADPTKQAINDLFGYLFPVDNADPEKKKKAKDAVLGSSM